jgi:uncharacterized repeat protein (TIGR01451 family)
MKKGLLLLLLLNGIYFNSLDAQGWIKEGYGNNAILLSDNNFLGAYSGFLRKFDPENEELWRVSHDEGFPLNIDSTYISYSDLREDAEGNIWLTGTFNYRELKEDGTYHIFAYRNEVCWAKSDSLGNLLWLFHEDLFAPYDKGYNYGRKILLHPDGGVYIMGTYNAEFRDYDNQLFLLKLDEQGQKQWVKTYEFPGFTAEVAWGFELLQNGNMAMLCEATDSLSQSSALLVEVDEQGNEVQLTEIGISVKGFGTLSLTSSPDQGFLVGGHIDVTGSNDIVVCKLDAVGNMEWSDTIATSTDDHIMDIALAVDSGYVITGESRIPGKNDTDLLFRKYTFNGAVEWSRFIGGPGNNLGLDLLHHPHGGYLIGGSESNYDPLTGWPDINPYFFPKAYKTDALGIIYSNLVEGYVFDDFDLDCIYTGEEGFENLIIKLDAENSDIPLYLSTDSLGFYTMPVDTGTYVMAISNKAPYWDGCNDPDTLSFNGYDTLIQHLPQQANIDCPYLEVDISTPFLRRCFENTYTITYCNRGTAPAYDAHVEISLDEALSYVSSTYPLASNSGNLLGFELNTVDVNECGTFQLTVLVDCDSTVLGQTHCVEAHIYPDTLCMPTPNWSGASIEVDASCLGDSIQFTIQNVGTAASAGDLNYLVIIDEVILLDGNFELDPGEQLFIKVPADGSTYRMEAQQEPFHPGNSMPAVGVEGCSIDNSDISLGYITQYWEDDSDPFVSIDCQENIGSYDPNDKHASPKGYGDEHFMLPNQEIEYRIRFQNTGTDTAFTVVIRDPISPMLNIGTLRPGASSHPYSFSILEGNVAEFRFENILLPDSTTNEPMSHGFVKFKIQQQPDLPDGTRIENTAGIVFDFNEAIITNTSFHTISRGFLPYADDELNTANSGLAVDTYPNPFSKQAIIILEHQGLNLQSLSSFELFDPSGRLLRRRPIVGTTMELSRGTLAEGIYFYRIKSPVGEQQGKIVIQ